MKELTLYHGSKSGIKNDIQPISRKNCDFGSGFYMGEEKNQALTLICNYEESKIYTLNIDITNLKTLELNIDIEWALFIAYNRGKMDGIKNTKLYNYYKNLRENYDVIIGYIANDRMFVTLDKFFNGEITDQVLIKSLSALNLGKQYVLLTTKACKQVKIIKEENLSQKEKNILKINSEENRNNAIKLTNQINKEYRRVGKYFDEIIESRINNE